MNSSQVAVHQFSEAHALVAGNRCPICGQPIPNEMLDEMRRRMEAHDQALSEAAVATWPGNSQPKGGDRGSEPASD